jgi:AraC-like DNA-binding protein/mannose-6-phosphate isomerase-like protein (cupin superfamily)
LHILTNMVDKMIIGKGPRSNPFAYFRYFRINDRARRWGMYVTTCGESIVMPNASYPPLEHPPTHHFDWQHGRRLTEPQIVYISEGSGTLETEDSTLPVNAGDAIVLVPNVWHRYKPDESTGWHEHWVGFSGSTVRQIFRAGFFSLRDPVVPIREEKNMLDSFHQIFQCAKEGTPGLQQLMAARTAVLLSLIRSSIQPLPMKTHSESALVEQARSLMLSEDTRELALEDIARRLNVSYSTFRRTFREHAGVSPHQYRLHVKVSSAREMLRRTNLLVKEISGLCGFDDEQYFCRIFKQLTGNTPGEFRRYSK